MNNAVGCTLILPNNKDSIITAHSIAKEMNLSFSCHKSSGIGSNSVVSPYVEFAYMALNPWKFSTITTQGKAESIFRLQEIYKEYSNSFVNAKECIDNLSCLLYTALDMFTRRERIYIINNLIKTGYLSSAWGDNTFVVEQSDDLAFTVYFMGTENHTIPIAEQKQLLRALYTAILRNVLPDIVSILCTLGKTRDFDKKHCATLIQDTFKGLPQSEQEELPYACINNDIQYLYSTFLFLMETVPTYQAETVENMYFLVEQIITPLLESLQLQENTSQITSALAVPITIAHSLGEQGLLVSIYAFDTTIVRLIQLLSSLQKTILEEKSIVWILNALDLFIHGASIDADPHTEKHLYTLCKTLTTDEIGSFWNRTQEQDFAKWYASLQFAAHSTNNATCYRVYTVIHALMQAASHIVEQQYANVYHYTNILDIATPYLEMLSHYGVAVEEAHVVHCLHALVDTIVSENALDNLHTTFFEHITHFGELFYKALTASDIDSTDREAQVQLCTNMLLQVQQYYGDISRQQLQQFFDAPEYETFVKEHTFLQTDTTGGTWFGSWLIIEILTLYARGQLELPVQQTTTKKKVSSPISVFQRSVQNIALPSYLGNTELSVLAERCVTSTEGIYFIRKCLQEKNVSQNIYISTYLQVAVHNKLISAVEAKEIYNNLHNTNGVDTPLFKVNLSNSLQLKGHLHEIRMASNAAMFGFNVFAMNKVYREDFENIHYEVDILMEKYGRCIGLEVKDLNDTRGANYKDVFDAVQKMGAFKRYQGDATTLAVLTQSGKPPSNEKLEALNNIANQCSVHVLYGGIREQLLQIDQIAQPKN